MIVIIGAGIAGLSLGYELIMGGQPVTILDKSTVASGASGIATSYLEPRLGTTPIRHAEREAMRRWEDYAADLEKHSRIDVGFRRDGQIKVVTSENLKRFEKDIATRREENASFEELSISKVLEMEPALSPEIVAGGLLPHVRWVTGKSVCKALAAIIEINGGSIVENAKVDQIVSDEKQILIHYSNGRSITAKKLVLCNGMGANSMNGLPNDIPKSRAVRGVNLVLDQSALEKPFIHMIKHHRGNICPREDGRLIVGTTYEAGETSLDVDHSIIELIYKNAEPIFPKVRQLPLLAVTAGLRTKVGDGNLCLGQSSENTNIYYSLSHAGAGFLRAPVVAPELAEFIMTGRKGRWTSGQTHGGNAN